MVQQYGISSSSPKGYHSRKLCFTARDSRKTSRAGDLIVNNIPAKHIPSGPVETPIAATLKIVWYLLASRSIGETA